jgi:hypothetical protein
MALLAGSCKGHAVVAMQTARRTLDPYMRGVWARTARAHHRNYIVALQEVRERLEGVRS